MDRPVSCLEVPLRFPAASAAASQALRGAVARLPLAAQVAVRWRHPVLNLRRAWPLLLAFWITAVADAMQTGGITALQAGTFRLPGPASTLVVSGEQIYGATRTGDLFMLESGRLRNLEKTFAVSPLTTCRAAVAGVSAQGELRTWGSGRMSTTRRAGPCMSGTHADDAGQ